MLRQQNCRAQLPVDFSQCGEKLGSGNGIKLTGWLVQNQQVGLQYHDRGQIQKLFLPSGQFGDVFMKPIFNSEESGHFGHPAANGGGVITQRFQPKGQFVPDLVCDKLILRVLLHETDLLTLDTLIQVVQRCSLEQNFSRPASMGSQNGF